MGGGGGPVVRPRVKRATSLEFLCVNSVPKLKQSTFLVHKMR